jgi:hypothetical protein
MVTELFAPLPSEIGAARHFAVAASEDWGCDPVDLGLVVSELATNACVHAHSAFTVSVSRLGTRVLVEVADADPTPARVMPLSDGVSGRGMRIVAAIARDWGVAGRNPGKTIWAVLDCWSSRSSHSPGALAESEPVTRDGTETGGRPARPNRERRVAAESESAAGCL